LLGLQRDILSDSSDIFDFGIEECIGIRFDFSETCRDRIRKDIDYTAGCVGEILTCEGEFFIISQHKQAISERDEDREHISSRSEIAQRISFDFLM